MSVSWSLRWSIPTAVSLAVLLAVAFGQAASPGADAPDKGERLKLVGLWEGYAVEGKGEKPDAGPVKLKLTITGETIHGVQIDGEKRVDQGVGEYQLDLKASPKGLDASKTNARGRKENYFGIYSLDGDTLKWCVSRKERPATFESTKGQFLLILKRGAAK